MSERPTPLDNLRHDYQQLSCRAANELSSEQRRSIAYYLADIRTDPAPEPAIGVWVRTVHQLDAFIDRTGRLPRADPRRPRPRNQEQRLVDWIAYQRRRPVRTAMCDYQHRRLEALPGFRWAPQEDAWISAFADHQRFWTVRGHAPRRRSTDPHEAALGRWVAHQRANARAGTLLPERERILRAARYRVL